MTRTPTFRLALTAGIAALALAGCAKKAPASLPPDPVAGTDTTGGQTGAATPGSQADFVARMAGQDTIYFDTDKSDIDAADQAALQTQAAWLRQYPAKRATIEGHADERGTREYNLALGERRANAAKNYLASIGIEPARISTVSYGKERPVALGSDEGSWARNRRAVTVTID
jgi:peptidoglycan-associated lipoprotein